MAECIFCKIIKKEIPAAIIYEDDQLLAFNDINPQAPVHILVIPKKHAAGIADFSDAKVLSQMFELMKKLAKEKSLDQSGYRIVVNHGSDAGQAVAHLHFHLLGGRKLTWPPG